MKDELISIIVAVYNAQPFIEKCLESLLNQSYRHIEIVLVDDGSTDDSYMICKGFERIDSRIKVVQKENEGSASARNLGLEKANGTYVIFVDADDMVDSEYIEKLYRGIEFADVAICGFDRFEKEGIFYDGKILDEKGMISKEKVFEHTFASNIITGGAWNKLLNMSILREHKLYFDRDIFKSEDTLFIAKYYQYCEKFFYVPEYLYHYRNNPNSKTQEVYTKRQYNQKKDTMIDVGERILELYKDETEEIKKFCEYRLIRGCIWVLFQWIISNSFNSHYSKKMKFYAKKYKKTYLSSKWATVFQKITVLGMSLSIEFVYYVGKVVNKLLPRMLMGQVK